MEEKRDFSAPCIILVIVLLGGMLTYQNNILYKQMKAQSELLEQYRISASVGERQYEVLNMEVKKALRDITEYVIAVEDLKVKQAEYKKELELKGK